MFDYWGCAADGSFSTEVGSLTAAAASRDFELDTYRWPSLCTQTLGVGGVDAWVDPL